MKCRNTFLKIVMNICIVLFITKKDVKVYNIEF